MRAPPRAPASNRVSRPHRLLLLLVLGVLGAALLGDLPAGPATAQADAPGQDVRPGTLTAFEATTGDVFTKVGTPSGASFTTASSTTATFIVTYTGFSAQAQTAFQAAVDVWSSLVTSSVPIRVSATWAGSGPTNLGSAGPTFFFRDFTGAPQAGTWYPVALANALNGADLNTGVGDINANFNSNRSDWYFGTDGQTPSNMYDLESVVLHELGHGLGFLGTMDVTAGSGSWGLGTNPEFPTGFDRSTVNGSNQSLINTALFPNPSNALGTQLVSNNVFFNGTNAVAGNGGVKPKLYSPTTWSSGSSISHFDETTFPAGNADSLMTPMLASAESIHAPGPATLGVFKDIGWTIASASAGTLQFTSATFTVAENVGSAGLTVSRTGGSTGAVTVLCSTVAGGTATAGSDYTTVTNQSLSWANGDSANKTCSVPITDDALVEPSETVNLALTSPTGGAALGAQATTVLTITDNDTPPAGTLQFTSATFTVAENVGSASLTVSRTGGSTGAVTVLCSTVAGGTATAGSDYTTVTNQLLSWANGDSANKTCSVPIIDDAVVEPSETVNLALTSPTGGATLGAQGTTVLTITDNDTPPAGALQFTSATFTVAEGGGTASLTVSRTGGSTGAVTVLCSTVAGGTATAGSDYTAVTNQSLSWANGDSANKTCSVPIIDDALVELSETVNLALTSPTGGAALGAQATTVLTITDNDSAPASTWYFAEGFTGNGWQTFIYLMNPNPTVANVVITYYPDSGGPVVRNVTVAAQQRRTLNATNLAEGPGPNVAFGVKITADIAVSAEEAMYAGASGDFAHSTAPSSTLSTSWYFAEGFTQFGWQTFVLVANPGLTPASVTITYQVQGGAPVSRTVAVGAQSRFTFAGHVDVPDQAFSVSVSSSVPVVSEMTMYDPARLLAHRTIGVTAPGTTWYLGEGFTAFGWQTFISVGNPSGSTANVTAVFQIDGGSPVTRNISVPANSRGTILAHDPATGVGLDKAFGVKLTSNVPVVVQEVLIDPNPAGPRANSTMASAVLGSHWTFSGGSSETGMVSVYTVSNPNATAGTVTATYYFEDLSTPPFIQTVSIPANSRVTLGTGLSGFPAGKRFGAVITSSGTTVVAQEAVFDEPNVRAFSALGAP